MLHQNGMHTDCNETTEHAPRPHVVVDQMHHQPPWLLHTKQETIVGITLVLNLKRGIASASPFSMNFDSGETSSPSHEHRHLRLVCGFGPSRLRARNIIAQSVPLSVCLEGENVFFIDVLFQSFDFCFAQRGHDNNERARNDVAREKEPSRAEACRKESLSWSVRATPVSQRLWM